MQTKTENPNRHPRGVIELMSQEDSIEVEAIDLKEDGIFFCLPKKEETIFVPYSNINMLTYEEIPKELRDEPEPEPEEV